MSSFQTVGFEPGAAGCRNLRERQILIPEPLSQKLRGWGPDSVAHMTTTELDFDSLSCIKVVRSKVLDSAQQYTYFCRSMVYYFLFHRILLVK